MKKNILFNNMPQSGPGKVFSYVLCVVLMMTVVYSGYSQTKSRSKVLTQFSFEVQPNGHEQHSNDILQFIAQGNGKMRAYTQFAIEGFVEMELIKTEVNNQYRLDFRINELKYSGDHKIKDYDLSSLLVPNGLTYRVLKGSKAGGLCKFPVEKVVMFTNRTFPLTGSIVFSCSKEITIDDLGIEADGFVFDKTGVEQLGEFSIALNDYYSLEQITGLIKEKLDKLKPEDPWKIILDDFAVCDIEEMVYDIQYSPLWNYASIFKADPMGIIAEAQRVSEDVLTTRQLYANLFESLHEQFLKAAKRELAAGQDFKARDLLKQSLRINPGYFEAHFQMIRMDLDIQRFDSAMGRVQLLWNDYYPRGSYYEPTVQVSDSVYGLWMAYVRKLIGSQQYTEAIKELESCFSICENIRLYQCDGTHINAMSTAQNGVFVSFLSVARRALNTNNLGFAESYLKNAVDYQQQHSVFIPSSSEAYKLYQELTSKYIALGESMFKKKERGAATIAYEKALALNQDYPCSGCSERISLGLSQLNESAMLNGNRNGNNQGSKERPVAITMTDMAKVPANQRLQSILGFSEWEARREFVQNYDFAILLADEGKAIDALHYSDYSLVIAKIHFPDLLPKADSLSFALAGEIIRQELSEGHLDVWANRLDEAKAVIDTVAVWFERYSLKTNPVLLNRFESLKEKYDNKQCENLNLEYGYLLYQARKNVEEKDFKQAMDNLGIALSERFVIENCEFSQSEAIQLKQHIEKPYAFQERLKLLGVKPIVEQDVMRFVLDYENANDFYKKNNLDVFGIEMPEMSVFYNHWSAEQMLKYLTGIMLERGNGLESLGALMRLEALGMEPSSMKLLQRQAGRLLKEDSDKAAVEKAVNKVRNNPWFKELMRSYGR